MSVDLTQKDLTQAEDFLVAYLSARVPEADFSPGSSVRDLCVTSIAHVFAFLRKELQSVKARQSLSQIALLPVDEDVDEAVDAILSNWFVTRKGALPALVSADLYFSTQATIILPANALFFHPSGIAFTLASGEVTVLPGSQMVPVLASDGLTLNYKASVLLKATAAGSTGNIVAGRFKSASRISDNFLYAETVTDATGGTDTESTEALLARAPLAISTRDLVNAKSISHSVLQNVPAATQVTVIGYGDPEMQRDLVLEETSRLRAHVGGCVDVYTMLPRGPRTVELTVGGRFARPDKGIVVLRETDSSFNYLTAGVQPGHILRVWSGLTASALSTYVISQVRANELEVHPTTPFTVATDESSELVTYSIGTLSPAFDNVISYRGTAETSRSISTPNTVVLPAGAVYDVTSVYLVDDSLAISTRVNDAPDNNAGTYPDVAAADKYQVVIPRPETSQSAESVTLIVVSAAHSGKTLRVTYETAADLAVVEALLNDPAERTMAASLMARAHHPLYANCDIRYTVRPGYTDPGEATIARTVAAFFEAPGTDTLKVGDLIPYLARQLPALAGIAPPTISYRLLVPDGQVLLYTTTDVITARPTIENGAKFVGAHLLRDAAMRLTLADCALDNTVGNETAITEANEALALYLADVGVTDRTTRVLGDLNRITASVR